MKKLLWAALILFCLLLVAALWQLRGSRTMNDPLTLASLVSDEIIFDSDGLVDYVAMLNTRLSRNINPDNNAFIDYARILGPLTLSPAEWSELCQWLHVDPIRCDDPFVMSIQAGATSGPLSEQNAWTQISMRPWTAAEFPHCARWLEENARYVEGIRAAAKKPQFYCPLVSLPNPKSKQVRMMSITLEHQCAFRELTRFMTAHAMFALAAGDTQEAVADLKTVHSFATQVTQGYCTVEKLVAIAYDTQAFLAAGQLLAHNAFSRQQADDYREYLHEHQLNLQLPDAVSTAERYVSLDTVQSVEKRGIEVLQEGVRSNSDSPLIERNLRWNLDWSTVARVLSTEIDLIVENLKLPEDAIRLSELKRIEEELKPPFENWFDMIRLRWFAGPRARGEAVGQILACLLMPHAPTIAAAEIRCRMQREIVDLGLAIAQYRLDNGRLPETLDLLVPKYMAEIPLDRFSQQPLIYRIYDDGFELISVGQDGKLDDDASPESFRNVRLVARPYKSTSAVPAPNK